MANIIINYIKILLVIILPFSLSKEDIIENPKLIISNFKYPIIFNGNNNYYNIITSGKIYTIEKLTGNQIYINNSDTYNSPYFLCADESENYYLYSNKIYYNINLNSFFEIINMNKGTTFKFDSGTEYVGCIKQNEYDIINNQELIFYGEKSNRLYFYYIKKNFENGALSVKNFNKKISCKLIKHTNYICAHINNNKIIISLINLKIVANKFSDITGDTYSNVINNNDNSDYVILFNTNIYNHKILCYNIKEKNEIKCFKIEFKDKKFTGSDLNINFNVSLNENNCYISRFHSEYLICCSGQDIVSCYRLNDNYEIKNKFELYIEGQNSNLTIIDNGYYASLFYNNKNDYSSDLNLFEYIIYPPVCNSIYKEIFVSQDFDINIADLFEIKANNKYYIKFQNLPQLYGKFLLNNVELTENNEQILNNQQDNILYFNSNNDNTVNNFTIIYNISIEIAYSSVCTIDLTILSHSSNCPNKLNENITKSEFKENLLNNILCIDLSSIINGFDFIAFILSSDNNGQHEEINKGISGLNLDNCVSELKAYYNLTDDQNLIVLKSESKESENEAVTLEVYDNTGQKLDISKCKSKIKVTKNLESVEGIDIQTAKEFSEQGVDVFNAKDEFFNDICHPFNSKDGIDITLSDRRKDIFQNFTFCQNGCSYEGIDFNLSIANCICDASILQETSSENIEINNNNEISLNNIVNSFTSSLLDFNFKVIMCYNLVLNINLLKNNYGFFSMFTLLFIQIILFFIFMIKRLKPIKNFMYIFKPKVNENEEKIKKSILVQNFIHKSLKKIETKSKVYNNGRKKMFNQFKNSSKYQMKKTDIIEETGTNSNGGNKIKNNKINFSLMDEDFQDMDYTEALKLDKRSCIRMYWSFLVDTQVILGTFCTSNFLHLLVTKISFLICTFQINFFLNALFYTDEYISDAYNNGGALDFFSGLPKSIYSFLATFVFTSLLGMLSNSRNELINTIKNRTYKIDYILQVNMKLEKLRNKLIIYYILLFIFGIIFLYYACSFCAVYKNSQKYWLIGCFESFIIDSLSSIGICIFLAVFRYISLKKKIKFLYVLVKLINFFL